MLTRRDVLVVVPAYNEEATVVRVVEEVMREGFSVVVVSDGSSDATAVLARNTGADVLSLVMNSGVGGALHAGFRFAVKNGFRAVIQCDADGQHSALHLSDLLEAVNQSGADLVIGSRFISNFESMKVGAMRRLVMKCLALLASRATGHKITDATSGFRIITKPLLDEFAESFPTYYLGDTFEAVVVAGRAGYQVKEIGVSISPRESGSSSSTSARSVVLIAKALVMTLFMVHFRIRDKSHYQTLKSRTN